MSECIKCGKLCVTDELEVWCPTCAANEIDRLAEVEVLAQAEIERLRAALREISRIGPCFDAKGHATRKMSDIARRALEGDSEDE